MPTNRLHFTVHQTFDLNTQVDKISVLGIRTPSWTLLSRYVEMKNWKKIKFNFANFKIACVSQLPVDPLGVGFEAGQVAPQELVNPMLFKTVTGESFDALLDVIYNGATSAYDSGWSPDSVTLTEQKIAGFTPDSTLSPVQIYYRLLGDDSFRQAHPQIGLEAHHLVPFVREVLTTRPIVGGDIYNRPYAIQDIGPTGAPAFNASTGSMSMETFSPVNNQILSGVARPMPAFDICGTIKDNGQYVSWPTQVCAVLVMPPAIQKTLYYRCIVSWNITLSEFIPTFRTGFSNDYNMYHDWTDVPVDTATATALSLMDDTTGILVTDGIENVNLVTENLT